MSRGCEEVDRLSSLPEDALSVILSLMPTKFAVQTSVLSKRWRYAWMLTHNLEFDDIPSRSYSHVGRVLMLCKTTRLKTFQLQFLETNVPNSMTVSKWISEAVRLNVSEIDIQLMISNIGLPSSLFTCNTLSKLSLKLLGSQNEFSWDCPPSIYLPNLKTLDISDNFQLFDNNINIISCGNILNLIHGCPLLEDLSLEINNLFNLTEDFYFKAPTLKRLRLALLYYWPKDIHKVVLNLPNLEYLHIKESFNLCALFVMEDLSSLVKAKVTCNVYEYDNLWVELLKGLSQVRKLTLDITSRDGFGGDQSRNGDAFKHFPKFPHVKKLVLVVREPFNLQKIPQILERFCQLEHLCIKKEHEGPWSTPVSFPALTFKNIVTVKYTDTTRQGKFDTQFLWFILGNAVDLKNLIVRYNTVLVSYEGRERLDAELSMFPRASGNCQIQLAPYNKSSDEPDNDG